MPKDGTMGPGTIHVYKGIDTLEAIVDMREKPYKSQPFKLLTKDDMPIEIVVVCFYEIFDPSAAYLNVVNVEGDLQKKINALVKSSVNCRTLYKLLEDKKELQLSFKEEIERDMMNWGVRITRLEILNIRVIDKDDVTSR